MVRRAYRQRSLVEVLLPDADKLWDSTLRQIDALFEPHTKIIRKGKLAKPTEFGRLVKIQEAEAQFITDYAVGERGQADRALRALALDRHIALFGRAPALAVADGGFASRTHVDARVRGGNW